jgi:hypothetical protein
VKGSLAACLAIALAFATASCLTSTSGTSASPSAGAPVSPVQAQINAINAELVSISAETSQLQAEETTTEKQRNESLTALVAARGGPRLPQGISDGEIYVDPGMMISMHTQNVACATDRLSEIRTRMSALNDKASKLKADRAHLEGYLAPSKSPSPTGGCFTPDTLVLTTSGPLAIGLIKPGVAVATWDEAGGRMSAATVVQSHATRENHYYIINETLRVTALHRFMAERGWVRTSDLRQGELVQTTEGLKPIVSIRAVEIDVAVANLEVERDHDFFVFDGKTAYLVHNTGGGGK